MAKARAASSPTESVTITSDRVDPATIEPSRQKPDPVDFELPEARKRELAPQWESFVFQHCRLERAARELRAASEAEPKNEEIAQALALIVAELEARK